MPAGADVVVPEEEVEPEDDVVEPVDVPVVVPVPVDVVVVLVPVDVEVGEVEAVVPAEVPVEVEVEEVAVELELGVLGVVADEAGAGFVTCCEVPAVGELPPLAFPPQPKAAIRTISRKQPASVGEKKRCMNTSRQ